MKIAAMAEAYEVNCAPHNFYGHMSTLMSAHFCAAIPNFRIMEIDIDDVPWKDDNRHRAAAHRERPVDHSDQARLGS
jgi:L-alanine-DL-glutamate epimerase-like enolase superfamily enzyme